MRNATSLPYRSASADCVEMGRWHIDRPDTGLPVHLGNDLKGWDYNFDLHLSLSVAEVNASRIREECGLPDEARMVMSVVVASPPARYRERVWHSSIIGAGSFSGDVAFEISGSSLSRLVELHTEVLLLDTTDSPDVFAPSLPGSRLWGRSHRVMLEGSASRFPMEVVNFEKHLVHLRAPRALWYLHWNPGDLEAPAMGAMLLYLNSRQRMLVRAAEENEPVLHELLSTDVARQLILGALASEEFMQDPGAFGEDTLGRVLRNLFGLCFPGLPPREVLALRAADPSQFEAMIQAGACGSGLLGDVGDDGATDSESERGA